MALHVFTKWTDLVSFAHKFNSAQIKSPELTRAVNLRNMFFIFTQHINLTLSNSDFLDSPSEKRHRMQKCFLMWKSFSVAFSRSYVSSNVWYFQDKFLRKIYYSALTWERKKLKLVHIMKRNKGIFGSISILSILKSSINTDIMCY